MIRAGPRGCFVRRLHAADNDEARSDVGEDRRRGQADGQGVHGRYVAPGGL